MHFGLTTFTCLQNVPTGHGPVPAVEGEIEGEGVEGEIEGGCGRGNLRRGCGRGN